MSIYIMKLYKSDKEQYLYVMRVNHIEHIYFGDPWSLNYIMANDRRRGCFIPNELDRENLKKEYLECIDPKKLNHFKSTECMEYYLLYNKINLKSSLEDFTQRFGVYITNLNRKPFSK